MNLRVRSWVVIFSTLFALGLTASLGFWQLGRASTKIALQESIADKNSKDPLSNSSVSADDSEASSGVLLHRSVRISGHWQTHNTTYLDNRQMGARQGFFVLTPLRLTGSDAVVVVQRGWIPRDFQDRTRLAAVSTSANEVVVNGRVTAAPSAIYALGKEAAGVSGQIMQNLDMLHLGESLKTKGLRLLPFVVLQTDPASEGLLRDWPKPDSGVAKHYGYAFQWFGLCAMVLVLYVVLVWVVPRRRARQHLQANQAQQSPSQESAL